MQGGQLGVLVAFILGQDQRLFTFAPVRGRIRTHPQQEFFLIKEDVLPGIERGAGHRNGKTIGGKEDMLQHGTLAHRKIVEAIHPHLPPGEPVFLLGAGKGKGQLIQRVMEVLLHQRLKRIENKLHIPQLLPQRTARLPGKLRHGLRGKTGPFEIGDGLQHGGDKAGVSGLPPVEGKGIGDLGNGFPHQQCPAHLVHGTKGQAAAFPEDVFRQAGEAVQGDIALLFGGEKRADPAFHLK